MARKKIKDLPDLSALAEPGREIHVRATPKAARDRVHWDNDTLRVTVTEPPEDGKANVAVRALLAAAMKVAPSCLTLTRGQSARDKIFVYDP